MQITKDFLDKLTTVFCSAQEFYAAFEFTRRLIKLDVICIFFLICFQYQVKKTCTILGFLSIRELSILWNTNLNKMGRIHDIWDNFWPQNVLF